MLKKLVSTFLIFIMTSTFFAVDAIEIDYADKTILWNEEVTQCSLATWENYIFAATDKGLRIMDVSRNEALVAVWEFTTTDVPGVTSGLNPSQVVVTDEYIIVVFGTQVSVFPNEQIYTYVKPTIICTLKGLAGAPRILQSGEYLYFFDMPVRAVQGKRIASGWKIHLNKVNEFPVDNNKICNIMSAGMMTAYSQKIAIGDLVSFWNFVECDGSYAYCVTYKKENMALSLLQINLDNFVEEEIKEIPLDSNSENFSSGTITMDNEYVYVITNIIQNNKLYIINKADFNTVKKELSSDVYSGFHDVTVVGNILFGLMNGINDKAAVIDISNISDITTNMAEYVKLISGISVANSFSNIVSIGNRLYYTLTDNSGIGVIKTNNMDFKINLDESIKKFPYVISGISTNTDEVELQIGDFKTKVPTVRGVWNYPIYKYPNGSVEITATADNKTLSKVANVEAKSTVRIYDVIYAQDKLFVSIDADEDVYTIAAIYGNNHKMIEFNEKTGSGILEINVQIPSGGYAKIYTFNNKIDLAPIGNINMVSFDGKVTEINADEIVLGNHEENIEMNIQINSTDKKAYITGNIPNGANRRVNEQILYGNDIKEFNQTVTDNNGNFEFEYLYEGDIGVEKVGYKVTVGGMGFVNKSGEFQTADDETVDNFLMYIKENISSANELKTYLLKAENVNIANEIGINFNYKNYVRLFDENQKWVLENVLKIIKQGLFDSIKTEFEKSCITACETQDVSVVNNAAVSTLTGILTEMHKRGQIDNKIFSDYENMGNDISKVNDIFVKASPITHISEINAKITDAIKQAKLPKPPVYTSGGGGGGGNEKASKITVPPVKIEPEKEKFVDIDDVPWAKEGILYLENKGIINGVSETMFKPNDNVTREEFVKMLILSFNFIAPSDTCTFSDVQKGAWYYEFVLTAEKLGLAKGEGNIFGIGKNLTREEMAVFAYRAVEIAKLKLPQDNLNEIFADEDMVSDYAVEAIMQMSNANIINGVGENLFAPTKTCTRAMAAKVIYKLLLLSEKGGA